MFSSFKAAWEDATCFAIYEFREAIYHHKHIQATPLPSLVLKQVFRNKLQHLVLSLSSLTLHTHHHPLSVLRPLTVIRRLLILPKHIPPSPLQQNAAVRLSFGHRKVKRRSMYESQETSLGKGNSFCSVSSSFHQATIHVK